MDVAPADGLPPEHRSPIYVVRETRELPQIDCTRAVKHVLFHGPRLQQCNHLLSRYKQWLALSLLWGVANANAVPFLPAIGGCFSAYFALFEFPSLLAVLVSLRYDMIRLIVQTYEFWNLTVIGLAFAMAATVNYQDARAIALLPSLVGFELLALQDANFRALHFTIVLFCFIAVMHMALTMYVTMHWNDKWHMVELFRHGTHAITADNIISLPGQHHCRVTAQRLSKAPLDTRFSGGNATVVRCITYRCRVRLCLECGPHAADIPHHVDQRFSQMTLVPFDRIFDSTQTVLHSILPTFRVVHFFARNQWRLVVLYSIGSIGQMITCFALIHRPKPPDDTHLGQGTPQQPPLNHHIMVHMILSVSSSIVSGLFCGFFFGIYQRQLLFKLVTSFDFIILVANITTAHLCVADTFNWTPRCFGLVSSWMWVLWATTTDALMPNMRHTLRFRKQYVLAVIVAFVVLAIMLTVEIVFLKQWDLQDRYLFQVWRTHIKVVQVLFSSLINLVPTCFRIAWRLFTALDDELILIQGIVEYEDALLAKRRKRQLPPRSAIRNQRSNRPKFSLNARS